MAVPGEDVSPDVIEQRRSALPDDDREDHLQDLEEADRPLTPDEIEQRLEVGWDDDEPGADPEPEW